MKRKGKMDKTTADNKESMKERIEETQQGI